MELQQKMDKIWWVVEFDCPDGDSEFVLRNGTYKEVTSDPDDLGCPVKRAIPAPEVKIVEIWDKNGSLRCEIKEH